MSTIMQGALTIALVALLPASAPAQSTQSARGGMGPQSSAAIQISVSIMPRFDVRARSVPTKNDADGQVGKARLTTSSNAPGIRYAVIPSPLEHAGGAPIVGLARSDDHHDAQLVLIVPD